jgi:hypothetical protein
LIDAVLIALLLMNVTITDLHFERFSHYSRTDMPSSQHRALGNSLQSQRGNMVDPKTRTVHILLLFLQ